MNPTGEKLAVTLLLFLLSLVLYWPAVGHDYVNLDDHQYILENPAMHRPFDASAIVWALSDVRVVGYWSPIMWFSLMVDAFLFGLKAGPMHLVNILLHSANAALVYLLFRRMTGHPWISIAIAALFAFHPLRVEPVAWVAGRKDVLSGLFLLLTVMAYLNHAESGKKRWMTVAVITTSLCLATKPMLVTMPLLLLLLDVWPLGRTPLAQGDALGNLNRRSWRQLLREKIPLFLVGFLFSIATVVAQHRTLALYSTDEIAFPLRLQNGFSSFTVYLRQLLFPFGLGLRFYDYHSTFSPVVLAAGAVTFLFLCLAAYRYRARAPSLTAGWSWYVVSLLPVAGFIPAGVQGISDRFMYAPSIGLTAGLVWWLREKTPRNTLSRRLLPVLLSATLVLMAVNTRHQLAIWLNGETLFTRSVTLDPGNPLALRYLGTAHLLKGRFKEASRNLSLALERDPDSDDAHFNLGVALQRQGHLSEALHHYHEAVRLAPGELRYRFNLAEALLATGETAEARREFEIIGRMAPGTAEAYLALGRAAAEGDPLGTELFLQGLSAEALFPETYDMLRGALEGR